METASDKPLFTPGPLTTSRTVREAMLRDLGSRDPEFLGVVRRIRSGLLAAAGVGTDTGWEAVPMQGSGTFGIEAVFVSLTPPEGRWLVVANGAYGDRMERICRTAGIGVEVLRFREDEPVDPARVADRLDALEGITGVATVHCETTSGIVNPVEAIAAVVAERGNVCFVDAMSAFGGIPLDLGGTGIDVLVSSANKCVEGVPGFSFALVKRELLERAAGWTRSLALDLPGQWRGLETNGQFRFTPPTHALLAFDRALTELAEEGGPVGRARRYRENHRVLVEGMRELGFTEYLPEALQGWIITSFRYPRDPRFHFETFYGELNDLGYVIYPGKVGDADCFRIGHIGRLFPSDMRALVRAIREVLARMGVVDVGAPG